MGLVDTSFYIIAVGASAGGLDAIKQLVSQVDDSFRHTFVIVQHISPDYRSLMPEILSRECTLPVLEVRDDMALEARHIYLVPPRSNIVIQGTADDTQPVPTPWLNEGGEAEIPKPGLRFSLVPASPRPKVNLPIDLFFHSLAEAVGERAIAIILSGSGSDGSRGLRDVKDRDGFVVVQDPETAEFDSMPQSAISTRLADLVAAPDAMLAELQRYIALRESGAIHTDELFAGASGQLAEILDLVSRAAEIDFRKYKEPTLKRRIARRVALSRCANIGDYLAQLRQDPGEIAVLHREFLVGVTNFFRDLPAWTALEHDLVPQLFSIGDQTVPVKVWSVGCSTGEEAYTAALMLNHYRKQKGIARDFRIFATDVNANSIRSAKQGIFAESILEEIPLKYRSEGELHVFSGTFQIDKALRNRMIFSEHNVLEDPPYINTDLVICRNMLIYLGSEVQKRVLNRFAFSLRADGFLFLGAAESVLRSGSGFEPRPGVARVYRNVHGSEPGQPRLVSAMGSRTQMSMPRIAHSGTMPRAVAVSHSEKVLGAVLSGLESCAILVDDSGKILETYGDYRRFLDLPEKGFSSSIFDLVRDGLRSALLLNLRRVIQENTTARGIAACSFGEAIRQVSYNFERPAWDTSGDSCLIVLRIVPAAEMPFVLDDGATDGQPGVVARLEAEIAGLQEMVTLATEELGVSNEELQSANEELTVSNEELQSSNEELQSVNEELHTINAEHGAKISLLEAAQADVETLLNTPDLGIILLDPDLAIRRFNSSFTGYVDLTPEDVGRRLTSFTSLLGDATWGQLLDDARKVLQTGVEIRRDARLDSGAWVTCRVYASRNIQGVVVGVLIALVDITRHRALQEEVKLQRDRLEALLESEGAGYWDWDIAAGTEYLSPRFKSMFGYGVDELENSPDAWMKIIHPDDLPGMLASFDAHVESRGKVPYDNEIRYHHKDGSIVWVICRGRVVDWGPEGEPLRMLGVHVDITGLKAREEIVTKETVAILHFAHAAADRLLRPLDEIERQVKRLEDLDTAAAWEKMPELILTMREASQRMRDWIETHHD